MRFAGAFVRWAILLLAEEPPKPNERKPGKQAIGRWRNRKLPEHFAAISSGTEEADAGHAGDFAGASPS
jgi:hypothetical protein